MIVFNFIIFLHRRIYAMKNISSKVGCALLVSSLVFLPNCQWLKDKLGLNKQETSASASMPSTGTGKVLATMNGKPLVTLDEFEKQYKNLIETHPYGAMLAQIEGIERRILDGIVSQKLMSIVIEEEGMNKTPEYKQQLDSLIQMLNARFFQMKHQPKVTDGELRDFYNKNKDTMPEAIVSRGGVNATGVAFTTEADAKAFLEKAKGKGAQLEKVAKDANLGDKYRDFKLVNATSPVEPALREKILAVKKFPSLEVVKVSDTSYYVVYAGNKEEPKSRSFEELKPALEQRLTAQKSEQELEKALDKIKKDKNVTINEEHFAQKEKKAAQKEIENDQQLDMVMPEAEETAQARPTARAA